MTDESKHTGQQVGRRLNLAVALIALRRRRLRERKAKRAAGEINFLNIVAMVDMMTIILIFLLKSVSISTASVPMTESLTLPYSTTQQTPEDAVRVFVTKKEIVVEDRAVAHITDGVVDAQYVDPKNGYLITPLQQAMSKQLERQVRVAQSPDKMKTVLAIAADKDTPYHIIMQIFYSAGKATTEVDVRVISFDRYMLMVLRSSES